MKKEKLFKLLSYVYDGYLKTFFYTVPVILGLYVFLMITGMYPKLDLKYDSPLLLLPLFLSLVLSVILLIFGLILYVMKYRRKVRKTTFYKALEKTLDTYFETDGAKKGKHGVFSALNSDRVYSPNKRKHIYKAYLRKKNKSMKKNEK